MAKNRYYVVWKGRRIGIFDSWQECKTQIDKYEDAVYKGFTNKQEAEIAFSKNIPDFKNQKRENKLFKIQPEKIPISKAIAVDAACSGNPGIMEYRGVWSDSGNEIFHSKTYSEGTNNIGEFLAIAHALALCKQKKWNYDIYSDSYNAILWIKGKKCKTKLEKNKKNAELFDLIQRAENWLENNDYQTNIIKWKTNQWGEIPADFGRK